MMNRMEIGVPKEMKQCFMIMNGMFSRIINGEGKFSLQFFLVILSQSTSAGPLLGRDKQPD